MEQTAQSLRDLRKGVLNERSKDLLLAFLIAIIGFTGSYLVLGKSFRNSQSVVIPEQDIPSYPADATSPSGHLNFSEQKSVYQYRAENLSVQGSMLVGGITRITNLAFDPHKSYLLDYGNGTRHRMTSAVMSIRYNVPGLYLLQCYIQENNAWKLQSAVTITIRRPQKNEAENL